MMFGKDVTNEELNAAGFFKVALNGNSFVTAIYYNPVTNEDLSFTARDYDYMDCSRDNDSLYNARIDKEVLKAYMHSLGRILIGDRVVVKKGRKVPVGSEHTVKAVKEIYDRYNRFQCYYLIFDDGLATSESNCTRIS